MFRKIAAVTTIAISATFGLSGCDDHKNQHCVSHETIIMPVTTMVGKVPVTNYIPITSCTQWVNNTPKPVN